MKHQDAMALLKTEFIFYSQWCFVQGGVNGDIDFHEAKREEMLRVAGYHRDMQAAGVKIHSFDIDSGWRGVNTFDPVDVDRVLKAFFDACPDGYLLPRITTFNAGHAWLRAHPDDICVYGTAADASREALVAMVGTDKQNGYEDDGVVCIGQHSFASDIWREDALSILRQVIRHIEDSPYADRIIGYHIGYGKCGETHFWGTGIDHSAANKKRFYRFGIDKYGSAEALAAAWGMDCVTAECVPLPRREDLKEKGATLQEFYLTGRQAHRDYFEYLAHLSHSIVGDFCRTVKEMTGKVVGMFHGYYLWGDPQIHGHLDLGWLLDDPNIDFMAAPKAYYRTGYGEPGCAHGIPHSVNRKKLWVDELDNRTHMLLSGRSDDEIKDLFIRECGGGAATPEETIWVMWREFARNEMAGSAYWWMDLGQAWYDDPILHAEMKKLLDMKHRICGMKRESISEILLVIDENAFLHTRTDRVFNGRAFLDTVSEVASSGTPYDIYRVGDLDEIDLSRYKLVVFLNPVDITAVQLRAYPFAPGTHFLWNYLPGGSAEEAMKITGMQVRETGCADVFPYLEILPGDGITVWETYREPSKPLGLGLFYSEKDVEAGANALHGLPATGIRTASRGAHTVCTVPAPGRELIRRLGEGAGCRFYAPVGQYVYGDSRFLAVFYEGGYRFALTQD